MIESIKKVLTFREQNILDDEICNHYQDLACDICECLKDYDWGRKIFEKAKEDHPFPQSIPSVQLIQPQV